MEKIFNSKRFISGYYINIKNRITEAKCNPAKRLSYTEIKELLKELEKMPKGIPILIMILLALLSISIIIGLIYIYIIHNSGRSFMNNLCLSTVIALNIVFMRYLWEKYTINKAFRPFKKEFRLSLNYLEGEIYELENYYNTLIHKRYAYKIGNLILNSLYEDNKLPRSVIKKVSESVEKHLEEFSVGESYKDF